MLFLDLLCFSSTCLRAALCNPASHGCVLSYECHVVVHLLLLHCCMHLPVGEVLSIVYVIFVMHMFSLHHREVLSIMEVLSIACVMVGVHMFSLRHSVPLPVTVVLFLVCHAFFLLAYSFCS